MTAPTRSTPHASQLPASQTAPVAEFRCLFTHDVRRKQKRWQDGFLKFHAFNSRVMVCDQARNHIGDTYWKESNDLQEGDELSLDKGVLVEVAEAMGISQTDLAPILTKKPKEPLKDPLPRPTASAAVRPFQRPTSVAPSNVSRAGGSQLRHKSLNTLLGTPRGPVGKAVPMKSPFEARKEREQENNGVEERAPKRQKLNERPPAWRASSPVREDKPSPIKPTPLWARTADAKKKAAARPVFACPAKVINISSESDHASHVSSDITLPSTPAKVVENIPLSVVSPPITVSSILPEPPPVEIPNIPQKKIRLPKKKTVETPKRPAPTSSPPVSASNRINNVEFAIQPVEKPRKAPSPPAPVRDPRAKSLRLSTGVKRATLLCQSMPRSASRTASEPTSSGSRSSTVQTSRIRSKQPSPVTLDTENRSVSRITPPSKEKRKAPPADSRVASKSSRVPLQPLPQAEDAFDDPEFAYGIMDQQLLIPSSPYGEITTIQARETLNAKSVPTKAPKSRPKPSNSIEPTSKAPEPIEPGATKQTTTAAKGSRTQKKTANVPTPRDPSPAPQPVLRPPLPHSREISPTHTDGSGTHSRPTSASSNKAVLSTGGFPKKPKRVSKKSTVSPPAPPVVTTEGRTETIPLSLHPLVNGKNGPLMSTSELASLLSRQNKRAHLSDPIEDAASSAGKSPARKIRRVRSENDAPIPSTAEDWEKCNLPKTSSNLPSTEVEVEVGRQAISAPAEMLPPPPPIEPKKKKESALAALVKRTDPRKKLMRTKSLGLHVDTSVLGGDEQDLKSPVMDKDVGPWSSEAWDLLGWMPPGREREEEEEEEGGWA